MSKINMLYRFININSYVISEGPIASKYTYNQFLLYYLAYSCMDLSQQQLLFRLNCRSIQYLLRSVHCYILTAETHQELQPVGLSEFNRLACFTGNCDIATPAAPMPLRS